MSDTTDLYGRDYESNLSVFERYAGLHSENHMMSSDEADILGLPSDIDERDALVRAVIDLSTGAQGDGDPTKGFGFAIASSSILQGVRIPHWIPHENNTAYIRPIALRESADEPFWNGFRLVFPAVARAHGLKAVDEVPSLDDILDREIPTPLAMSAGNMLTAQTVEAAVYRDPFLGIHDTNPGRQALITIDRSTTLRSIPKSVPAADLLKSTISQV